MGEWRGLVWVLATLCLVLGSTRATDPHGPGTCATYGICGHRSDGDVLSCAETRPAPPLGARGLAKLQQVCPQLAAERGDDAHFCCTEEQLDVIQRQIQIANIFLVGCPACAHNFKQLFCLLSCHPDQATFTNVTATQRAADTNATAVANVTHYVAPEFGTALYDSCKDVTYPVLNQKAMKFVGGGAANYQEWLDFIGTVKDARFPPTGSPFQMDFPPIDDLPEGMAALNDSLASCCSGALACSCGDCPNADGCTPPPAPPKPEPPHCGPIKTLTCGDLTWILVALALVATLPPLIRARCRREGSRAQLFDAEGPGALKREGAHGAVFDGRLVDYPGPEALLRRAFFALGELCGLHPWRVVAFAALAAAVLAAGTVRLRVETDPERLWVGAGSQAAREKAVYEAAFGPFFRISQVIISTDDASPITTDANVHLLFDVHEAIERVRAPAPGRAAPVGLSDVCFRPLGGACAVQSAAQYWQLSREVYEHGAPPSMTPVTPEFCYSHWNTQCLSAYGAPVDPHVVLGGFPRDAGAFRNFSADATAFVVTLLLEAGAETAAVAEAWEGAFLEVAGSEIAQLVANASTTSAPLRLSYSAQRSVADELRREGWADAGTVAASYALMLIYIALAMSSFPRRQPPLLHTRFGVGLAGVLVVAAAVAAALGALGWAGAPASLIVMEVIPFLALAIGVDNMFILAAAVDARAGRHGLPDAAATALALAAVGPSILLAAACEASAFALGALTSMPALRHFSLCAAAAVALDFALQITVFVAVLALDLRRVRRGRADLAPWIRLRGAEPLLECELDDEAGDAGSGVGSPLVSTPRAGAAPTPFAPEAGEHTLPFAERQLLTQSAPGFSAETVAEEAADDSRARGLTPLLRGWVRGTWAPFLRRPAVKAAVVTAFALALCASLAALPRLERGLEQATALPQDSYLQGYFADVADLLRVGPPLFFVAEDLPLSPASELDAVCSISGCDGHSFLNNIAAAAQAPWSSRVAAPAASWLDDFMTWVDPEAPFCCRLHGNVSGVRVDESAWASADASEPADASPEDYCPPPDQEPCASDPGACADCAPCLSPGQLPAGSRPSLGQFQRLLPLFMRARPSQACAKGGAGAYDGAVAWVSPPQGPRRVAGLDRGVVAASAFRTAYTPLSTQADFIEALASSRALAERESESLHRRVYAYSIFHVFFEQYLSIGGEATAMLCIAGAAVFILALALTGTAVGAAILLGVLASLVADLAGFMALAGIQLNAVSTVNLVAALGIGVEFCAHLLHAFLEESGGREARAGAALAHVGAPVLSGITLTKVVGVAVLAFARTAIFRVYFFKMYAALVVLGALHGLALLPVLLSLLGPEPWDRWGLAPPSGRGSPVSLSLPSDIFRDALAEGGVSSLAEEEEAGTRA